MKEDGKESGIIREIKMIRFIAVLGVYMILRINLDWIVYQNKVHENGIHLMFLKKD